MNYAGKKVLIIGMGKTGRAVFSFLLSRSAFITVNDVKRPEDETFFDGEKVSTHWGNHDLDPTAFDFIVVSPGVDSKLPLLLKAQEMNVPILSEIELAVKNAHFPLVAVTGTNGKTTTVSLIAHLLKEAGKKVVLVGNVGDPLINYVEKVGEIDFFVLEISSFQMEFSPSLEPLVSIWLNLAPDHLDRHSFEEYAHLKARLLIQTKTAGTIIYNAADENLLRFLAPIQEQKKQVNLVPYTLEVSDSQHFSFHLFNKKHLTFSASNLKIRGKHNYENIMAACLALEACGIDDEDFLHDAVCSFKGLEHRLQYVGTLNAVSYYNDSKATNVAAAVAALQSFSHKLVLIAGGIPKEDDFSPLVSLVKDKVSHLVLLGTSAKIIADQLGKHTVLHMASSMDEAVKVAYSLAFPGESVLLSPACASFDLFAHYAERGNSFKAAFLNLEKEIKHQQVCSSREKSTACSRS
ncbi:MAG: UDP-N-acetylmuramoyl-L-alanine--D-glutamate ligase [Deltaproteobacteria bacterium CG_4_10_14_0_2_um_filter_43_8]|nr:MAG: UDP-N-acetylmuramoyl-L-alanine--D-glutamate ligase [Deltaproteobacteria bacterium CG11_big_fil_rev_8_21_14_0_20_42_23]PJA18357.1 MAG: UDP-N-acetylmuramoyl-L-alanine--D-glutamate ligase [Deltaproteobacteria bacterium CG_4_10_14_0_2_um_filter_43_8]PJC65100.1 MAG: UDP-N-acetylmuramoyl-L-alanine--D-glutamate ligase [Deltaproteobacteria bacterium CG_4_9_14_0_2_um_filter_42_21]